MTITKKPSLSVIIPNYNYGHYIGETLDSVITQTLSADEVIIVDDCSTDNSVAIIEKYMKDNPCIRLLRNNKNMGVVFSINRGLSEAKGDYVYFLSSDDKLLPDFIKKSLAMFDKYPNAGLCCADNIVYDDNMHIENRAFLRDKQGYIPPEDVLKLYKREAFTPFIPHTAIIRRSAMIEAGGFLPELKWSCDSFVYSVVSFRYGICYIPEKLTIMRIHAAQYGRSNAMQPLKEREIVKSLINTALRPEYRDVLPMFKMTAPFSSHPWEVLAVISGNRAYWSFLSYKLIRFAIFDKFIKRPLKRILPSRFNRSALNMFKRLKAMIFHINSRNKEQNI